MTNQADGARAPVGAGSQLPTREEFKRWIRRVERLAVNGHSAFDDFTRLIQQADALYSRLSELEKDAARLEAMLQQEGGCVQVWRRISETSEKLCITDSRDEIDTAVARWRRVAGRGEQLRASSEGARAQ